MSSPREQILQLQAQLGVVSAIEASTTQAFRSVEQVGKTVARLPPPELVTDATKQFTLLFGANNHGERNDCGCHKNPLGGLGRRHTMLAALKKDEGGEVWGETGLANGAVFHVDGGDFLFANNTADRGAPDAQKLAKYDAKSVVLALATFPPDAVAVGEHDLVFGADYLRKLTAKAGFPLVSANLRHEAGELAFPASVVVERDGVKVAFVGLTKKDSRIKDYFADRKLKVDDPQKAAQTAIGELPPVDAVVLLSNLGLVETTKLVAALRAEGTRVEFAVASSTNSMTGDPEFSEGVPVMEPTSRGKYIGRADLWLNGEETAYRNASVTTVSALRDFRRAVRSYWSTRKQVIRERLKIAELELSLETLKTSQQADVGEAVDELTKRRVGTIESQRTRLVTFEKRRETTADALMLAIAAVMPPDTKPSGDDWVAGTVVPVKIEFKGEPSTRKVLDPREAKRPKAKGRGALKLPGH